MQMKILMIVISKRRTANHDLGDATAINIQV